MVIVYIVSDPENLNQAMSKGELVAVHNSYQILIGVGSTNVLCLLTTYFYSYWSQYSLRCTSSVCSMHFLHHHWRNKGCGMDGHSPVHGYCRFHGSCSLSWHLHCRWFCEHLGKGSGKWKSKF